MLRRVNINPHIHMVLWCHGAIFFRGNFSFSHLGKLYPSHHRDLGQTHQNRCGSSGACFILYVVYIFCELPQNTEPPCPAFKSRGPPHPRLGEPSPSCRGKEATLEGWSGVTWHAQRLSAQVDHTYVIHISLLGSCGSPLLQNDFFFLIC